MADVQVVLDALSSPVRREILWRLWEQELPAGQIAAAFELTASTISEHLAVLRDADLVVVRRAGNRRYYRARTDTLRGLNVGLTDESTRWVPADDLPDRGRVDVRTGSAVVAVVDLPVDQSTAFTAFMDADLYTRWLGVPVRLQDGHFSCTLPWGTQVRGRYEHVVRPSLIAMHWDFDDGRIPLPGGKQVTYLRVWPISSGSRVEVQQLVDTPEHAPFMQTAWTFVLGQLAERLPQALRPDTSVEPLRRRRKRSRPAGT
jgi:DNA-binding transcriptional ArsR family regulator/uncharacterized protein YndB with AHSA1/START domain